MLLWLTTNLSQLHLPRHLPPGSLQSILKMARLVSKPYLPLELNTTVAEANQLAETPSTQASEMEDQPSFRLLDLPAELRLLIYELALTTDQTLHLDQHLHSGTEHPHLLIHLLQVSKAVHADCIRILYSMNKFTMCDTWNPTLRSLHPCRLGASPEAMSHVRDVSLRYFCCPPDSTQSVRDTWHWKMIVDNFLELRNLTIKFGDMCVSFWWTLIFLTHAVAAQAISTTPRPTIIADIAPQPLSGQIKSRVVQRLRDEMLLEKSYPILLDNPESGLVKLPAARVIRMVGWFPFADIEHLVMSGGWHFRKEMFAENVRLTWTNE